MLIICSRCKRQVREYVRGTYLCENCHRTIESRKRYYNKVYKTKPILKSDMEDGWSHFNTQLCDIL